MFKKSIISSSIAMVFSLGCGQVFAANDEAAQEKNAVEVIEVRGVKASIISARNFKMESNDIIDSIVAEDIGKLPDNSVASAVQRVTGVQVSRTNGEVDQVLIRGLPDVVTTMNGRNVFTTTGRSIALADIPADLVYKIDVKKSQSASDHEGGIAGAIDVQLRRPFDFDDGFTAAGGLRYEYSDKAESWNPIGSVTLNNNWESDAGKFGALISVSHQNRDFMDQVNFVTAPNVLPDSVVNDPNSATPNIPGEASIAPNVIGGYFRYGDRTRDSINASFQWAPTLDSSYYFDFFSVDYEQNNEQNFWVPLPDWGGWGAGYVDSYKPGTNVAQSFVRPDNAGTITSNQSFSNVSDTKQYAIGGKWYLDNLTVSSDLSYTDSTASNKGFILDLAFFADNITYDYSKNGSGVSDVDIRNADGSTYDMTDLSIYELLTFFDQHSQQEGSAIDWTLDASYQLDDSWITSIDFGTRLSNRKAFNQEADTGGRGNQSGARVPLTDFSGMESFTPTGFMSDVTQLNNTQWLTPDADYLLENRRDIREAMGYSPEDPEFLPARYYDNTEKNYAAYIQANFAHEINNMLLEGRAGLRVVRLDTELNGNTINDGVASPITVDTSDTLVLPSVNLRLQAFDNVYFRASYGETISLPNFADLNPGVSYFSPSETSSSFGTGDGGNPELKGVESVNYDLSAEWYFDETSSVTAGLFYREIDGYIQFYSNPEVVNGTTYNVTRPENTGAGTLEGVELAYTQFFDNLPDLLQGLGVQVNATFLDGETEGPDGEMQPLVNISDKSYNAVLMYERGDVSARLAWNWRSEWFGSFNAAGAQPGSSVVHDSIQSLDFSVSYDLNENVTLSFDGTNITDDEATDYFGGDSSADATLYPRDTYIRDRTFSLGVRVRM